MKEIFIGGSTEGLDQAKKVAAFLSNIEGVRPVLWSESFLSGHITFTRIEELAARLSGAVFLATPDDRSRLRDKKVQLPRTNVLFEYGYFVAILTRSRVALCRYDDAELPSDFAGLTYIPMGPFTPDNPLNPDVEFRLRSWIESLPQVQAGMPPTSLQHGYSGLWQTDTVFKRWRGIPIRTPDYAFSSGQMLLHIPVDGQRGVGCATGNLQVQIGECYAEFLVTDVITDAQVLADGSLRTRLRLQNRLRIALEGAPPQRDGYEVSMRGARSLECTFTGHPDHPGVLEGRVASILAGQPHSIGIVRLHR